MRAVKYLAATVNVLLGGYLLLSANGIFIAMQEQAQGIWRISEVPSYPVPRMVLYAIVALALQSVSAWLLTPAAIPGSARDPRPNRYWVSYASRVILFLGAAVLVAPVLAFVVMALLDAGVI